MSRRVFTALALELGVCVFASSAAAQGFPDVVPLPPGGPGAVIYYGEGHQPPIDGDPPGMSPFGLVPVGDVDGDGFDDILCAGVAEEVYRGFLIFGEPDARERVLDPLSIAAENLTFIHPPDGIPYFNPRLGAAGDVDGDGYDDFFIMARYLPHDGGLDRVHLIFGSPDLREAELIVPPAGIRSVTWRSSGELGGGSGSLPLAAIGDFDGDGMPEFAFSAPSQNGGNGLVFVVSWRPEFIGGPEMELEQLGTSLPGFVLEGVPRHDGVPVGISGVYTGRRVSAAGDLNGDGFDDLYVVTIGEYADVVFGGPVLPPRVPLDTLGDRGLRLLGPSYDPNPDGMEPGGIHNGTGAGDIDGDGHDDLVVGTFKDYAGPPDPWRVHVVWGRPEFPRTLDLLDPTASGTLLIDQARDSHRIGPYGFVGDLAGEAIAAPGDVDGDGYADVLVGARLAHRQGLFTNGMAYLIYGGPELRAGPEVRQLPEVSGNDFRLSVMIGEHSCDELSYELLAGAGDFDGDGSPDLAVGASRTFADVTCERYDPTAQPERRRLYLFLSGGEVPVLFRRGDSNRDGHLDISDPVNTLNHLFSGGEPLLCLDAGDANDDGLVDITDPISTLQFLFQGAAPLPPPHEVAGEDPTADSLGCSG